MPLLSPSMIHEVLRESGVEEKELSKILDANGLSTSECVAELGSLARGAEHEQTRLQAIKTGLQLNGVLNGEEAKQVPHVTIIIKDSEANFTINPILLPRQVTA